MQRTIHRSLSQPALVLPVVALVAVALRAPFWHLPLERDEGAYGLVAWRWLHGATPYAQTFDHKPPLIYALYAAVWLVGGPSVVALRVAATLWFAVGLAALHSIAAQLYDRTAAAVAALLYAVAGSAFAWQAGVVNTEQALTPLALLALLALLRWQRAPRRRWALAWGALVAAVALIKPTAVPLLALGPLLALPLPRPRWRRSLAVALLGAALVFTPFALYFLARGAWSDLVWALVTYNREYLAQSADQQSLAALADLWTPMLPLLLVAIGGLALPLPAAQRPARRVIVGWTVAFAVAAVASLRPYVHYWYPVVPGLALLAAPVVTWQLRRPATSPAVSPGRALLAAAALVALLVLPPAALNLRLASSSPAAQSAALYGNDGELFAQAPAVATTLAALVPPGAPVWVWGAEPEIYLLADRPAATRWIFDYPVTLFPALQAARDADFARTPPAAVVVYDAVRPPEFARLVTARGLVLRARVGRFEIFALAK